MGLQGVFGVMGLHCDKLIALLCWAFIIFEQ